MIVASAAELAFFVTFFAVAGAVLILATHLARKRPHNAAIAEDYARGQARNALRSLPAVERRLCGPLILRQVDRGPWTPREVEKYGPEGCIRLCSCRAMQVYTYPIIIVGVGFSVAGISSAEIVSIIVLLTVGALGIVRAISASKAGREWRAIEGGASGDRPPLA